MKKFFVYVGLVLLAILMIVLGGAWGVMMRTEGLVSQRRAAIQAAGDPLYLTDYARPPIADEENAHYYLMQAQADLEAFDSDFTAIAEALDARRRLRDDQVQALAALVEKYPQLYERIDQAAACPHYDAQRNYAQGLAVLMPDVSLVRSAARAWDAKAKVLAHGGDGDRALAQSASTLRLSAHLAGEPLLISHLVFLATQAIAGQSTNYTLRIAETSPEARAELDKLLEGFDMKGSLTEAMKGERAMGVTTFEQLRSGKLSPADLDAGSSARWLTANWLGRAYLNDDEARYLDLMQAQIDAAELSIEERDKKLSPLEADLQRGGFRYVLTRMLVPSLNSVGEASDRSVANVRVLRVLLAAEGVDSPRIDALGLPPDVTFDPFQPRAKLILRGSGDAIVVYSVGLNQADDGGDFDDTNGRPLDIGFGPLLEPLPAGGENP